MPNMALTDNEMNKIVQDLWLSKLYAWPYGHP